MCIYVCEESGMCKRTKRYCNERKVAGRKERGWACIDDANPTFMASMSGCRKDRHSEQPIEGAFRFKSAHDKIQ